MDAVVHRDDQFSRLGIDYERSCFSSNPAYISALARSKGGAGVVIEVRGTESYFVPLVLAKKSFLRVATFLDAPRDRAGNALGKELELAAVEAAVKCIVDAGLADRITQPMNWCRFQSAPAFSKRVEFGSYVLDLRPTVDQIWKGLHQKHRNSIRAAEKAGVRIGQGKECVSDFHRLYRETLERSGMAPEGLAFFEGLASDPLVSTHCAVAYDHDAPLAGVFILYSKLGAYYLYGATSNDMTISGANSYLHYRTIVYLKDLGVASYDFVGARLSDVSGTKLGRIQQFKARFGGELQTGVIWKMDINKVRCAVYDRLLRIRQAMRGAKLSGDIIDQELSKA